MQSAGLTLPVINERPFPNWPASCDPQPAEKQHFFRLQRMFRSPETGHSKKRFDEPLAGTRCRLEVGH